MTDPSLIGTFDANRAEKYNLPERDPRNWLLVGPCPCEQQTARKRGYSHDAVNKGDVAEAMYLYHANRQGQHNTTKEAVLATFCVGVSPLTICVPAPLAVPNTIVNVGNATRYRKTKRGLKNYIRDAMGEDVVKGLQKESFDDRPKLHAFMSALGLPISDSLAIRLSQGRKTALHWTDGAAMCLAGAVCVACVPASATSGAVKLGAYVVACPFTVPCCACADLGEVLLDKQGKVMGALCDLIDETL